LLDSSNRGSQIFDNLEEENDYHSAAQDDARAVAEIIGMKGRLGSQGSVTKHSPLTQVQSVTSEGIGAPTSPDSDEEAASDVESPEGQRVMKSPELQDLESPVLSGDEEFPEDEPESPEQKAKEPAALPSDSRRGTRDGQ
jgi:hypothetical protein